MFENKISDRFQCRKPQNQKNDSPNGELGSVRSLTAHSFMRTQSDYCQGERGTAENTHWKRWISHHPNTVTHRSFKWGSSSERGRDNEQWLLFGQRTTNLLTSFRMTKLERQQSSELESSLEFVAHNRWSYAKRKESNHRFNQEKVTTGLRSADVSPDLFRRNTGIPWQ